MNRLHTGVAGCAALATLALLSGCTLLSSAMTPEESAEPASRTAVAEHTEVAPLVEGAVIARGTLADASGTALSAVTLSYIGSTQTSLAISLPTDASTQQLLVASPDPVAAGDCADPPRRWLGIAPPGDGEFLFGTSAGQGDPSFIDAIALLAEPNDDITADCRHRVLAVAPLEWDLPDQRPDLPVADSGPAQAANGTVEAAEGAPVSYTVARNDTMEGIAQRFGITEIDIRYLNPLRSSTCGEMACAEEVLNLDRARR